MTRVDFYLLNDSHTSRHEIFACRLVQKAFKQGHEIMLQVDNEHQAKVMDDLLWTWNQGSFIPHEPFQSDSPDCPVFINHQSGIETAMQDVLINMADEVPMFFSQFDRVAEIVEANDKKRQQARERYRFYQERGYPLETHEIS